MVSFDAFFRALWASNEWPKPEPFPWQRMLGERAAQGEWPQCIDLPTASGKTGCLDAAIFALAATAKRPEQMPRRIWFVVDRRIVVDEAYQRALQIARKLCHAVSGPDGPLKDVAKRFQQLSGTDQPLAVARLRGGVWRDDGWALCPSQPAIICSTVDQVGSALLFRAYGHGENTASIFAGLAANDSLILLDEAHCAIPFMQTLQAVGRFRSQSWAAHPLKTPFHFCVMSATPPAGISNEYRFPKPAERAAALDHPLLDERCRARKLTALQRAKKEEFVDEAVTTACSFLEDPINRRIAVMVNRVATAERIAERGRIKIGDSAEVILLTGRMRPLDRDQLVQRWEPVLKSGSREPPAKPLVLVTTQCLEVGADFDFDALVAECASLDALRQRFGRLDRLGKRGTSRAVVLIHEENTKEPKEKHGDPIYGNAIYETWQWLNEPAQLLNDGTVDFGIDRMNTCVKRVRKDDEQRFQRMLAPSADAPVLLPAHLNLLCQTSPRPTPEPEIALFLHGKARGAPEARVVIRADLPDGAATVNPELTWIETLSAIPPASPEMLSVPLYRLRLWLAKGEPDEVSGDVEGLDSEAEDKDEDSSRRSHTEFLIWRGRRSSELTRNPDRIRPNDVVVLRSTERGLGGLGQIIDQPDGLGRQQLDLAERALLEARGRVLLRVHAGVLARFRDNLSVRQLLDLTTQPEPEKEEIETALAAVQNQDSEAESGDGPGLSLPAWLNATIKFLLEDDFWFDDHPTGGLILTGRKLHPPKEGELGDDPLADEEDLKSSREEQLLRQHTSDVCSATERFVELCLPGELREEFDAAARCHDLGKLDRRFQVLLRNGNEDEVTDAEPLAKSQRLPQRYKRRQEIEDDLKLPRGFRHEFLSVQLAERLGFANDGNPTNDLILHLIASHHGYARPFPEIVPDPQGGDVSWSEIGPSPVLLASDRQALPPAHRLDSGTADRFWRLTRRFGWWGLAYLEALLRLADWFASSHPGKGNSKYHKYHLSPPVQAAPQQSSSHQTAFDALDAANPLAFLAALGTLRLLSRLLQQHDLRMNWQQRLGAWRPVLWTSKALDQKTILDALVTEGVKLDLMFTADLLAASKAAGPRNKKGEDGWEDKLKFPIDPFRQFCKLASRSVSILSEFAATWASETAVTGTDTKLARRTRFDFTAGNQAFIDMLRQLRAECTMEDLRRSLFTGWHYSTAAVSMRWDTQDEKRQYALQAIDPTNNSKNPPIADLGANFLAVEALPLFPLVPDSFASQPGFGRDEEGRSLCWPIWAFPVSLDVVRSLLALPLASWPVASRSAFGTPVLFRSAIVQPSGRYRCFAPAESL